VAPLKAAVFPLVQQAEMDRHARAISANLTRAGLANTVDTTGALPNASTRALPYRASPRNLLLCLCAQGRLFETVSDVVVGSQHRLLKRSMRICSTC
jgi:hypothetical protein